MPAVVDQGLRWLVAQMESVPLGATIALFGVSLVLQPLGILVHELGHALTARRFGARVDSVVAAAEGPAVKTTVAGLHLHLGLGLGRDLRSREPAGWAQLALQDLTAAQTISVLRAGPIAQAAYGAIVGGLALALPLATLPTVLIGTSATAAVASAVRNLNANGPPESDGARIAALRARDELVRSGS